MDRERKSPVLSVLLFYPEFKFDISKGCKSTEVNLYILFYITYVSSYKIQIYFLTLTIYTFSCFIRMTFFNFRMRDHSKMQSKCVSVWQRKSQRTLGSSLECSLVFLDSLWHLLVNLVRCPFLEPDSLNSWGWTLPLVVNYLIDKWFNRCLFTSE